MTIHNTESGRLWPDPACIRQASLSRDKSAHLLTLPHSFLIQLLSRSIEAEMNCWTISTLTSEAVQSRRASHPAHAIMYCQSLRRATRGWERTQSWGSTPGGRPKPLFKQRTFESQQGTWMSERYVPLYDNSRTNRLPFTDNRSVARGKEMTNVWLDTPTQLTQPNFSPSVSGEVCRSACDLRHRASEATTRSHPNDTVKALGKRHQAIVQLQRPVLVEQENAQSPSSRRRKHGDVLPVRRVSSHAVFCSG